MNDTLKRIIAKHAEPQADLLAQRTPASQAESEQLDYAAERYRANRKMEEEKLQVDDLPFAGRCPQCGAHGIADKCPFSSDDVIISNLAAMIVEEFSTRDAKMLVRLLCTEGPRIGLELHEALNAPEEG